MKTKTYKVALITGGNRGLGLQTARELGRLGIITILGVRDPEKGKAAAAELKRAGFHAEVARLDVADSSTHSEACNYVEKHYGKLDIKVNSAHPGWVKTEMGGEGANLDISEGGKTSAWLATLPADGPTGGYFHMRQPLPW